MIRVDRLTMRYGDRTVLAGVSFDVAEHEIVSVVGPSGCGKTTLLRCVAGLTAPTGGTVTIAGQEVTGPPPGVGVVFQHFGLFPWLRVAENIELPLKSKGLGRAERRQLVDESLTAVGLADAGKAYPWQLSGGMQQRVAIARAIAFQPKVMLMDEPFAAVDAQTRADLEDLVRTVWKRFGITILFVTHDIDESVYLADRVVVLTHSPTEVKEVIPVALPKPRDQIATKALPEFAQLRAHVYRLIKREQDDQGRAAIVPVDGTASGMSGPEVP